MKRAFAIPSLFVAVLLLQCVLPLYGHQQTAPWLDESSFDRGLYIEVRHPRVIRNPRPFGVSIAMSNLLGDGAVVISQVRYLLPDSTVVVHPRDEVLSSRRNAYLAYKEVLEALEEAAGGGAEASIETLSNQSYALLAEITRGTFRDQENIPASLIPSSIGAAFSLRVEIDLLQGDVPRTIRRSVSIPVQAGLPTGPQGRWRAGDQHLHTAFSIDAFFVDGTRELVSDYASVARLLGLSWNIITDHTNVDVSIWYDPGLFLLGEILARSYRNTEDYLLLQGQEMGVGSSDPLGRAAHLLVYPRTSDSIGFVQNPCTPLGFNCEPDQVIIDRVNDRGGIGFIAHPFTAGGTFSRWNREHDAVGWAGLEIFNDNSGVFARDDLQALGWWYDLLKLIPGPQKGQLQDRPDYPTRFPVGLGNSDAHNIGDIGAVFTYANLNSDLGSNIMVPREALMDAFVQGRLVASNGPLVFGEINGAGIGEVAVVMAGGADLTVTLQTTQEFGSVDEYSVLVDVDGARRTSGVPLPDSGDPLTGTLVFEGLIQSPDRFVNIIAVRDCSGCPTDPIHLAIANPIWLEFQQPAAVR